ncbi:iron ABC transporter permease [Cytobacillus firmus]|uniref:FecCD family ABC transporter permease n=1 Tax=Cytobacillus firmus TaxID=1399 RepID=UPI001C8E34B1|nr:iron ABC transporter permease [Cytobacillus firmus]MBX9975810.1 iron ABC transporter permease [Cytobacillus firmus]
MEKKNRIPLFILGSAPFLIVLAMCLSILYGAKNISMETVWDAVLHYDASNVDHAIIMTSSLPRAAGALIVGAFLAISGAIMQGMTRNYLASPSIMGVSDGSAFVITVCMVFFSGMSSVQMILFSMLGSLLGAGIVFGTGSLIRGGLSPVRLAIIGTIIGTFLSSLSAVIATYFQVSQNASFWYNARIHQIDPDILKWAIPIGLAGFLLALSISKSITILSLGEEMSISLGQRTKFVRAAAILTVVILTGTAVALVGKIGFVGLIIPHITRFLAGLDYKWIIPCSGVLGGVFLALCDVLSRFVNYPFETPIGVITSLIGVPFFLYLIRKKGGRDHA